MSKVCWTPEQQAVLDEQSAEVLVSAAAGSGKTAVLVERVLRAALGEGGHAPVPLDRLAAVTFTRAAAAELRAKIYTQLRARLEARLAAHEPAGALRNQLAALPRAQINTIHGLCAEVLRRFGHTRGLTPARQLAEPEAALILHRLAGELLDEYLGRTGDPLRAAALAWGGTDGAGPEDLSGVRRAHGLRQPLLGLHAFLRSLTLPQEWLDGQLDIPELDAAQCDPAHPLCLALDAEFRAWAGQVLARDEELAAQVVQLVPDAALLQIAARRRQLLSGAGLHIGWDHITALFTELRQNRSELLGCPRRKIDKEHPLYEELEAHKNSLRKGALAWQALFSEPWAQVATRENAVQALLRTLGAAAFELDARYARYKTERGLQDFADLERGAFTVLAEPGGGPSAAALELRAQFELLVIDEHQDTSPLQDAILELLTPDAPLGRGRPRIMVGDIKQSIYTFRLAAPELFRQARDRLGALPPAVGRALKLSGNFRSRGAIIGAVNDLFDGLMTDSLGGEDYHVNRMQALLEYDKLYRDNKAEPRADAPVCLHLLDGVAELAAAVDDGAVEQDADSDDDAEAVDDPGGADAQQRFIARLLKQLHAAGKPVYCTQERRVRPVRWLDMAVLLRTAAGRVEGLKAAFDAAGVPYYAPGRSGFYERPEVADALSLLRAVDNPRQDIALAAVLRGPAVRLDPCELLSVARSQPGPQPAALWERIQAYITADGDAAIQQRLAAFTAQLTAWRDLARRAPLPELLWRLYLDTGLLVSAAAMPGGAQRVANLHHLLGAAQEFTQFHRQGLSRFLDFLAHSRRAAGDQGEAPLAAEGQDAVRVMTVHQAKGLEFPIVVVPDLHRRFNLQDAQAAVQWHRVAGIGGLHTDWHSAPPRRRETLRLRAVKQARHSDAVAEELRKLYVALTRAREELHLVAMANVKRRERFSQPPAPAEANSWLDWIGARLAGPIQAASTGGAPVTAGPDGCWAVALHTADASAPTPPPPAVSADFGPVASATLTAILAWRYPHAAALRLPAKLTVTRLVRLAADGVEEETLRLPSQAHDDLPAVPQPACCGPGATPTPADIGEATHRLLARLDFAAHTSAQTLAALRDELAASGYLAAMAAARIDLDAVLRLVHELAPLVIAPGTLVLRELPLALLVPAPELAGVLELAATTGAEREQVYVQGTADLLLATSDSVTVIDYKTDRADAGQLLARYRRQLEWYARAAAELAPGQHVQWALYGLRGAGLSGPFAFVPDST